MTESAYLKEDLGPVLAKGLAAVAIAKPSNPTEYLALWLKHYLQQRSRKIAEVEQLKQLEAEREEWAKGRGQREKSASTIIQREWNAHVNSVEEARQKEAALRDLFAKVEESLDERFPEETVADGPEKSEQEKETEQLRLTAQNQFARAKAFAEQLDKSYVSDMKRIPTSDADVYTVLKCCLYAMGSRPRQIDSPEKIRGLIKPYPFTKFIETFNPIGSPLTKKRLITRIRRLLSRVSEENVKKTSAAVHAIFNWLNTAVNCRVARDEHIKLKKSTGKEVDEEYEEEEDAEDEEKDPAEEAVRAEEVEAQRLLEAQRAAEAVENAEPTEE